MPTKRMLVDAIHPEETRIVVTSGNRLEEFDFESASRRQLRGNIYLAKVTRVEPSLQAAFIEYGGNRHGFLAFSEIHPDYYQIPVADREALLAAEEEERAEEAEADEPVAEAASAANGDEEAAAEAGNGVESTQSDESVDSVGGDDAIEEAQQRKRGMNRKYKIQEVVKRRQVMLVQVVKEERGNKGAALTTYLSLAGRYSVLMPNTARGGGISRKITNSGDRKRLKEIAGELEVPQGMGIILRTAGAARTKAEVKRDFEYLLRLWENVRSLTLESTAPCLVYEEGSLIKRTIRDLYNKDIDEVQVAGDNAYKEAKDFMRMIMPSHAKNVQPYKDDQPIFSKFNVESQLDSMFSPQVTLPSGGYIVINPTEALVSIDVNSGRATREHNIEDTAYQTNLEAADEVARQLRLRDLAGLIVIDFIDMIEKRSIRNVERRLKDALKNDRARIQVGRISHFGLMEMSRQRIRFGVVESSTHICPTCHGAGIVRSVESLALMVMRSIEDHAMRKPGVSMNVRVPVEVALYLLNSKRASLMDLEVRDNIAVVITADAKLSGNHFNIERTEARGPGDSARPTHISVDSADMGEIDEAEEAEVPAEEEDRSSGRRRRRRRGGRGRSDGDRRPAEFAGDESENEQEAEAAVDEPAEAHPANADGEDDGPRKRRRRGRRGGRRNRRPADGGGDVGEFEAQDVIEGSHHDDVSKDVAEGVTDLDDGSPMLETAHVVDEPTSVEAPAEAAQAPAPVEEEKPKKPRRARRKKADAAAEAAEGGEAAPEAVEAAEAAPAPSVSEPAEPAEQTNGAEAKPAASRRRKKALPPEGVVVTSSGAGDDDAEAGKPKKAGWWQRGFLG